MRVFINGLTILVLTLAAAAGLTVAQAGTPAAVTQARTFIDGMGGQVIGYLKDASLDQAEKKARLKGVLQSRFDMPTISRFALGKYWKQMDAAQQAEYQSLFEAMVVSMYAERFSTYSGQEFKVSDARADEKGDVTVASAIVDPAGGRKPIAVNWRVRIKDGAPQIIDVTIEDVSMIITQRAEFASIIQRSGGNAAAIIAHLRTRTGG
jgi:phospholipid transport system substrate-binding protein